MEYIYKNQPLPFDLKMQKFPYPKTIPKDKVMPPEALSAFTVLCLVLLCPYIIKRIVQEKESGIKELMKMMGLKNWMLWFGWFINAIFVNSISVTSIVLVLTVPFMNQTHMIFKIDVTLLWVFLMMYCISSVVFCMAFSTFFSNPNIAMSCGIICWILSYVLPMKQFYDTKSLSTKLITSLHPNMALHWGFQVIQTYEAKGVGLSWGSINEAAKSSDNDNPIRMSDILAVMVLDVFIYGIVMWYVDAVLPGKYGLARPWYFCFMVSYWKRGPSKPETIQTSADSKVVNNFERPNADLCVGIKLKDIHKVYYSPRGKIDNVAVENVTFDIYQGQITALLGHNGAGKTTTMSILTGT
ncbi:unnamed protein product, partial [Timema podura]|nr:unnamed protein product [Timema podura]